MNSYAVVRDGVVVNTIVLDSTDDVTSFGGQEVHRLGAHLDGQWGIGWRFTDEHGPVGELQPEMTSDVATIPADGATAATVTVSWPSHPLDSPPEEVTFTVNGAKSAPEPVVNRAASIEVVSNEPGEVTVEAAGASITITAEAV